MGTLVDREIGVEKDSASDPVVYQLVRVIYSLLFHIFQL